VKRTVLIALGVVCAAACALHGDEPKKVAPPALIRSARSGQWSEPDTWEGGKVPGTGAKVQVRTGHTVTYDISSDQVIRSIHIAGTLAFARDRDTRLDVGLIKIQAGGDASEDGFNCDAHLREPDPGIPRPALEVGTATEPIPAGHTALIRLAAVEGLDKESCPAIVCCGGRLDLHGAPLSRTWVKLGATANAGHFGKRPATDKPNDVEIKLAEAVTGWRVGDHLIVTTTSSRSRVNQRESLRPGPGIPHAFTEERQIKAIAGERLTLDRPLDYWHQGEGDYRGEVANLSRNVIIESADPAKARGHTMYHKHSAGAISYAELRHLGKEGLLGKYPIHIHLAGDTMRGSYVQGASIWDSGNRWVTIHGTNYFIVRDCVGFQSVGHGFYLEDGTEVLNVLDRNLAVQAFVGKPLPEQFLPFDHNDGAGFWWANSLSTFTRNVAVECDRYGFRFEATPTKGFDLRRPVMQPDGSVEPVDVRTLPFLRFEGNEAHDQLFGINLGGLGGDFFKGGVDGVVPDFGNPFLLQSTRIWNTHWALAPHTRYALDDLDIADSTYGLFLPAYDAEAQPKGGIRPGEMTDWGRVTFRRTQVPVRLSDARPKYFGEPFDLMDFAHDTLPPATVLTHVQRVKSGALLVRGTTSENNTIAKVIVNGSEAKLVTPNFAEWEITLSDLPEGEFRLSAHAVDAWGNIEPRPHRLLVQLPRKKGGDASGSNEALSLLNLPDEKHAEKTEATVLTRRSAGSDAEALQGTWQMVSQQRAGRATARPKNMKWVIDGNAIWLVVEFPEEPAKREGQATKGGKPSGTQRGPRMTFRLSPAMSPKQIDIDGPRKSSSFGIYKLDGDELTVCMGVTQASPTYDKLAKVEESTRPTALDAEAGTVIVLKRVTD
jgi:uncharacterized protein (TIGR03067 family)